MQWFGSNLENHVVAHADDGVILVSTIAKQKAGVGSQGYLVGIAVWCPEAAIREGHLYGIELRIHFFDFQLERGKVIHFIAQTKAQGALRNPR